MCVYMHSRFVENHPIRILKDGPLISEGVLSQEPFCVALKFEVDMISSYQKIHVIFSPF
jgi:hypothetical protein